MGSRPGGTPSARESTRRSVAREASPDTGGSTSSRLRAARMTRPACFGQTRGWLSALAWHRHVLLAVRAARHQRGRRCRDARTAPGTHLDGVLGATVHSCVRSGGPIETSVGPRRGVDGAFSGANGARPTETGSPLEGTRRLCSWGTHRRSPRGTPTPTVGEPRVRAAQRAGLDRRAATDVADGGGTEAEASRNAGHAVAAPRPASGRSGSAGRARLDLTTPGARRTVLAVAPAGRKGHRHGGPSRGQLLAAAGARRARAARLRNPPHELPTGDGRKATLTGRAERAKLGRLPPAGL